MSDTDHQMIPFRIRLGVTGHRKLENENLLVSATVDFLKRGYREFFDQPIERAVGPNPRTPIVFSILTPLAEGADRLVAEEVLKLPDSRIEVVLPLTREDYIQDFKTEESRRKFEELLNRARKPPVVLKKPGSEEGRVREDPKEARHRAYQRVGRYVVDHCDVLIALWDGQPAYGPGGTAEIVKYAEEKHRPVLIVNTGAPYGTKFIKGNGISTDALKRFEVFNIFRMKPGRLKAAIDKKYQGLFERPEIPEGFAIPDRSKHLVKEGVLPFSVRASEIASKNQGTYLGIGAAMYRLSVAAIAAVVLGILIRGGSAYGFGLELVLLLVILLLVLYANGQRAHQKWIENRFLAERLRSAVFFVACGAEASPISILPFMGAALQLDDWMVRAFDEIWSRLPLMQPCQESSCRQLSEFVRKCWIRGQIKYHRMKSANNGRNGRLSELVGSSVFGLALLAALSHLVFFRQGRSSIPAGFAAGAAIVLPAIGSAISSIAFHREWSRIEKRSRNMVAVLTDLESDFVQVSSAQELETLLRQTEELMLQETEDWLMLMKSDGLRVTA